MARYYFHIDGEKPHEDGIGESFADDQAAWKAALRLTRDIEAALEPGQEWRLEVLREESPIYLITISSRRIGA